MNYNSNIKWNLDSSCPQYTTRDKKYTTRDKNNPSSYTSKSGDDDFYGDNNQVNVSV